MWYTISETFWANPLGQATIFQIVDDDDINVDKSNDWQEPSGRPRNKACWHAPPQLALFVQKVAASFPNKDPYL